MQVLDLVRDAPALILLYGRPMPGLNTARHIFLEEAERDLYAGWENCTLDVVGHLRLATGKYPEDPHLASLIGELAMGSERFCRLWARADVRARTLGRKTYWHPLVGLLELHHENFALPDESGIELLVLYAAPAGPAEDALRLLADVRADNGHAHPPWAGHRAPPSRRGRVGSGTGNEAGP